MESDDYLVFAEPPLAAPNATDELQAPWKVLVVDDDPSVHELTSLALRDFRFEGRGIQMVNAYSGKEAKLVAQAHPDAAMMLLDVVMEDDCSGLDVVRHVREVLNNHKIRIVLRTGQPGSAPQREVIAGYDINDYKEKTELTSLTMYTLMHTCLRGYRDICFLEKNQLALESALSRVREHTEQLDSIFHLSPDGIVSFDAQRRVKYTSPTFLRMTGLVHQHIIGMAQDDFSSLLAGLCGDPAQFPGIAEIKEWALQARAKVAGASGAGTGPGGRVLMDLAGPGMRVLEVGMRLADTDSVSQILYFRDVTHETEVDRMKSVFLSHAAHELRTPMVSIYGYAELMIAREFAVDERRDFLGIIHRQSALMITIINELLDLVRIEEQRGKDFDLVHTDVGQLLQEVVADFGVPAGQTPALVDAPRGQHWVLADQGKMMQAVRNILSNAYKYSRAGGGVQITLVGQGAPSADANAQQQVGIRITDQGLGMTPDQTARVYERFYRADASGSIPGTGLGMSIVKEIVELHGGTVQIESRLGQGTTVTLWMTAA